MSWLYPLGFKHATQGKSGGLHHGKPRTQNSAIISFCRIGSFTFLLKVATLYDWLSFTFSYKLLASQNIFDDFNNISAFGKLYMSIDSAVRFIKIDAEYAGQRLDNFLRSRYKSLPKSRLYRIIRKGEVRVNKKRADPDYRIQAGDEIRLPPVRDLKELPKITSIGSDFSEALTERVIYEDKHLFILNKPAGMAVHSGSGVRLGVIEALRILYPQEKYFELAHRLDRATSGCLLIAKRPSILKLCHALLRENKMNKQYILLVKGKWPAQLKKVDMPLEGKESVTYFKVLKYYKETTLLEATLETGRNHQIRLHATEMGFPLVGDEKYGDWEFNRHMEAYGCARLFLHAARLSFQLEDKSISVEAPLDDELKICLERLEKLAR